MSDLTAHQQAAFDAVYERLSDGVRYTTLRGYAGTGKTYLLGRLVDRLMAEGEHVRVCAPTHKAAQVLQTKIANPVVRAQTIHSFLGLRLVPDGKGGYTLDLEKGRELPSGDLVLVDEASMVGAAEWKYVEQATDLQWLFVGDPAQLPPVNEDPSPIFDMPGPTLEEIVRQQIDNPILDLATRIRHRQRYPKQLFFDGDEGVAATRKTDAFVASALRAFGSDDFKEDGTYARLLAYRNRTVRSYNRLIRTALYGDDAPRFVKGEWLVGVETWFVQNVPVLINSEEVRVTHAEVDEDDGRAGTWKIWRLEIRGLNDVFPREINVLHEDDFARYDAKLAELKTKALQERGDWKSYYTLREHFARVDYAYATTIHKAQGSTFDTAFVDHRDAMSCRGNDRQALLYVAVTRPARRLALLM